MGGCSTKDKKTEADTPPAPEKVDYDFESMTSKQLKALLTERGIDSSKCLEKADLIKCLEVAAQLPKSKPAAPKFTPAQVSAVKSACLKLEGALDRRDMDDAWNNASYLVDLIAKACDKCPQLLVSIYGSLPILTSHLNRLGSELQEISSRGRSSKNLVRCLTGDFKFKDATDALEAGVVNVSHTTASA